MRPRRLFPTLLLLAPLACATETTLPRTETARPERTTTARPRTSAEALRPPVATKRPVETALHGETRVDDYAWLRQRENPDVIAHLRRENTYAEAMMAHTRGLREKLYAEILRRIKQTDLSVPYRKDDWFYYSRTVEGLNYPILARKAGSLEAAEQVMLDLNELAKDKEYLGMGATEISPDHKLLAYGVDFTGAELYDVFIKDLATGETRGPVLTGIAGGLEWGEDNATLFYSRRDASMRPHQVWRHVLGTQTAQDVLVHDEPDPLYFAFATKTLDEAIILFGSFGKTSSEWRFIPADQPASELKIIAPRRPQIQYYPDHHPRGPADPEGDDGGTFFILTDENAPNFKIVTAPVSDPAPENWKDFVAHDPDVFIDGFEIFRDHIVLSERRGGFTSARILTLAADGSIAGSRTIEMPEQVATISAGQNAEFDTTTFRFNYTSYVTPQSVYDIDMTSGAKTLLKQQEVLGGYNPADYETGVTWATATDGTRIPISYVHRKGISPGGGGGGGGNPMFLYAYGSYGASEDPFFQASRLPILDRGVIFATAHVRGGGEMGRHWKEQGRLGHKMNTFTDFIACAEHLIAKGGPTPTSSPSPGAPPAGCSSARC